MIGHYGQVQPNAAVSTIQDIFSPFTGQAAQSDLGQLSRTAVDAAPSLIAQIRAIGRPADLAGLVRREATLLGKLSRGGNSQQLARWEADLQMTQEQLLRLRGSLNAEEPTAIQIQQAPSSYTWILASAGALATIAAISAIVIGGRKR